MTLVIQKGILPTLEATDDAGKVVMVNSTGDNYILGTISQGGSPMPLNCETDSATVCQGDTPWVTSLDAASLAALTSPPSAPIVNYSWAISDAPAVGVKASVSKAAAVGIRHVVTALSFSVITETTAPTTATLTVSLKDGATVLMTWRVRVSAAMTDQNVAQVVLDGLNIIGTVNTAMTLEFNAGDLNTLEDVSLSGYSV